MKPQALDFIGDIHGHYDKLITLLARLGYEPQNTTYRHAEGRKVVFLGDYIDRGPRIRETLHLVRGMVDCGDAVALMGNHEFNAICYATPDGDGGYLRPHNETNNQQHAATLDQFAGRMDEWAAWIDWMKSLPLFKDFGGVRGVHACWDAHRMPALEGRTLRDEAFLQVCAKKGTPEYMALANMLKGPELHLPTGVIFKDQEGVMRTAIRTRWWDITEGMPLGQLAMPVPMDVNHPVRRPHVNRLPDYPRQDVPVMFGHYWIPAQTPRAPLAANIACLDFSGAVGDNPLCAYRWNGEKELTPEGFVSSNDVAA